MDWSDLTLADDIEPLPVLPGWITVAQGEAVENSVFLSGAALALLHLLMACKEVPQSLLRDRLSLKAAEACMAFSGCPERAGELRDALHLLRPGDLPGPAGEIYLSWRRAVEWPVSIKSLCRAVPELDAAQIAEWIDAGKGAPETRAAMVLEVVLTNASRAETSSLILADAALGQALGWDHVVPLLAAGLKRADLRKRGEDLRLACHRAVVAAAIEAARFAADLGCRAGHLKAVAPKLRAKGAGDAVEMFLTRDAIAPTALPLPDRAARRLCDRLVELDAVHELTGRDTFRLYGV